MRLFPYIIDNLWSILFTTGCLTQSGEYEREDGEIDLAIPNREINWIYKDQIQEWFKKETRKDAHMLGKFCSAFAENDAAAIESGFNAYLRKTISIRDTGARKGMKENFCHVTLLGLLAGMRGWTVRPNARDGDGCSGICAMVRDRGIGIVIEIKYAENAALDAACADAMRRIRERHYGEALIDDGMDAIYRYGIACCKKMCRVDANASAGPRSLPAGMNGQIQFQFQIQISRNNCLAHLRPA